MNGKCVVMWVCVPQNPRAVRTNIHSIFFLIEATNFALLFFSSLFFYIAIGRTCGTEHSAFIIACFVLLFPVGSFLLLFSRVRCF